MWVTLRPHPPLQSPHPADALSPTVLAADVPVLAHADCPTKRKKTLSMGDIKLGKLSNFNRSDLYSYAEFSPLSEYLCNRFIVSINICE